MFFFGFSGIEGSCPFGNWLLSGGKQIGPAFAIKLLSLGKLSQMIFWVIWGIILIELHQDISRKANIPFWGNKEAFHEKCSSHSLSRTL
jgi:hypothetical protein